MPPEPPPRKGNGSPPAARRRGGVVPRPSALSTMASPTGPGSQAPPRGPNGAPAPRGSSSTGRRRSSLRPPRDPPTAPTLRRGEVRRGQFSPGAPRRSLPAEVARGRSEQGRRTDRGSRGEGSGPAPSLLSCPAGPRPARRVRDEPVRAGGSKESRGGSMGPLLGGRRTLTTHPDAGRVARRAGRRGRGLVRPAWRPLGPRRGTDGRPLRGLRLGMLARVEAPWRKSRPRPLRMPRAGSPRKPVASAQGNESPVRRPARPPPFVRHPRTPVPSPRVGESGHRCRSQAPP
jgi:hypothetical protein